MSRWISRSSRLLWLAKRRFSKHFKVHNRIEISRAAVINNYKLISKACDKQVLPVLKANAYGHGIEHMTKILSPLKPKYLVVDGYFEALEIWAVTNQPVLIMGAINPANIKNIPHKQAAYFVQDVETVTAMGNTGRPFVVHLECDTGMSRYGASLDEIDNILAELKKYPRLIIEGVATHFAEADKPESDFLDTQLERFEKFLEKIKTAGLSPTLIHAGNTAGSLRANKDYLTAVRPGIAVHGFSTLNEGINAKAYRDLKPTMKMTSTITKTRLLKKGDSVSYGRTFVAERDMKVGVIPMGYYEGIPRELSNKGALTYGDQDLPIIGRVCMNHTIVDLTDTKAEVGSEVVVLDRDQSKRSSFRGWKRDAGIYPHQAMANISANIFRDNVN